MIEEKIAAAQLNRLTGLNFFPSEKPAQRELLKSLMFAESAAICKSVVDDWISESADRPTPAEIRRMIIEKNSQTASQKAKCRACGGTGAICGWYLVAYRGNSFTIARRAFLGQIENAEQASEYIARLMQFEAENPKAERQTVLPAARGCHCTGQL